MAGPTVETAIWLALKGRVASLALSPSLPVMWPGVTQSPAGAHIAVMNIAAPPARVMVASDGPHEREGTLQLMLKHPLPGLNYEHTQEQAGIVAEHFPADHRMSFGGVCVRVTEAPEVSSGMRDEGWWITPVRIRWQAQA